jgi:methylamine dehydrogenase accessory protein MauD
MEAMWISMGVLWVVVILLAVTVLALARQVGLLHERIAPAGALAPTSGPKVGEAAEAESYAALSGQAVTIGGPDPQQRPTLVLFTSPTCPVCRELVPVARSVARREGLRLVFASDGGDERTHMRYAATMQLDGYPYVLSQPLGLRFGVSRLPFAVLISGQGVLAARGLVNNREHLESLLESMRTGITSIQDYLAMEQRQ